MSQALREGAIGMLTAGMSTRAVACEFNVHFSTVSRLQRRFREFGSAYIRPHNDRPCVTTQAQDLHIQHLHLQDRLRPATRTAATTIDLHSQIISAQTVRNRLREAHLHARRPHQGLDLTAVCHRNRLEWANAHIRWHLALWRGVLFMDEFQFSLGFKNKSVAFIILFSVYIYIYTGFKIIILCSPATVANGFPKLLATQHFHWSQFCCWEITFHD